MFPFEKNMRSVIWVSFQIIFSILVFCLFSFLSAQQFATAKRILTHVAVKANNSYKFLIKPPKSSRVPLNPSVRIIPEELDYFCFIFPKKNFCVTLNCL